MQSKRNASMLVAILMLVAVSLTSTGLAAAYGNKINVDALKTMEEEDVFPVHVIEKKVVEECFDVEGYFDSADDALVITVQNDTDEAVTGVKVCFVAYDEEFKTRDVSGEMSSFSSFDASPEIYTLSKNDLSMQPSGKTVLSMRVDFSKFVGVRALVAEYTREDGSKLANPIFEQWQNLAFGLSSANAVELD